LGGPGAAALLTNLQGNVLDTCRHIVCEWPSVWPAMAEISLAAYNQDNADAWSNIVTKFGLASGDLRAFVGQGDQHADFAFAYGGPAGPVAFVSAIKLRKAGFNAAIDTRDAFCAGLRSLIDRHLLPPARHEKELSR
jgi:hypothetical protein